MKVLLITALVCFSFLAGAAVFAASERPRAEIVTDEVAGIVSIVIDGATIATFDATGITVTGDVSYTGAMTDVGAAP